MSKQPIRQIKCAVDLRTMSSISSDDLLNSDIMFCKQLRRDATTLRRTSTPIVCGFCSRPVYVARHWRTLGWYFQHFGRGHYDCIWFSNDGSSVENVSARKFLGNQEGHLHKRLKAELAEILAFDPLVEDIIVDRKLKSSDGDDFRCPDIRATYDGRPIAIEVQLATTQLPIILERESFYQQEKRHLIWVTWDQGIVPMEQLKTAFLDILTSHRDNLFVVNEATLAQSSKIKSLRFLANWWEAGKPKRQTIGLNELKWPKDGLPYYFEPPPAWEISFKARWIEMTGNEDLEFTDRLEFWRELIEKLALSIKPREIDQKHETLEPLVKLFISLEVGKPIGTRVDNLTQMLNTFFSTASRKPFAKMAEYFTRFCGHADLLNRRSTRQKLEAALTEPQKPSGTLEGKVILSLFPNLIRP